MAKADPQPNQRSLVPVLTAAWATVLLIAFFANRGDDVGRLGQLIGDLGGGALLGEGALAAFYAAVGAALIFGSWLGVGHFAFSAIRPVRSDDHSHILELATKAALGAAVWSAVWLVLGTVGLYSATAAVIAIVLGQLLFAFSLKRIREVKEESRVPERATLADKALLLLIAFPLGLSLITSLAPPTAKDTLLYHFSVPKQFIVQGSNAFVDGNIASYLALGTEMHSLWAMLLGSLVNGRVGEAAAGGVIWLFFPLLLATVFGFAREIGISRRWSLIAVLMVASVPTAYHVASSAYIDLALALYVLLGAYVLTRWWKTSETRWLVLMAIFLGAALSSKLTTLFVIAAFALLILFRVRKAQAAEPDRVGKIAAFAFGALLMAGVIASPWYVRTWAETGSPIFPFYLSIVPAEAPGWDVERSNLFQMMNSQYGGYEKSPLDYLLAPWNISVTAQPEIATHFDGVLGIAFLIGLPLLIHTLWKFELPVEARIFAAIAAVMFLFWLFSSQQLRYLLPIVPLLAISIAASVQAIAGQLAGSSKWFEAGLAGASAAMLLVTFAWFAQKSPLRVVLGGETPDSYLARNIDYYPYYQWLNTESAPDSKVWLINMRRDTYHLDRPYFSDYLFEDWTLRRMVWESRNGEELKARAAALGVQYILTRHDFLFDHERSPLVDDARPKAENEAKLRMAHDLVMDKARTVKADQKFSLVKVF